MFKTHCDQVKTIKKYFQLFCFEFLNEFKTKLVMIEPEK